MPDAYLASSCESGALRYVVTLPRYRRARTQLGGRRVVRPLTSGITDSVAPQRKLSNKDLQRRFLEARLEPGPLEAFCAPASRDFVGKAVPCFRLVSTNFCISVPVIEISDWLALSGRFCSPSVWRTAHTTPSRLDSILAPAGVR